MNILKDTAYPVDQTGYPNFSITAITVICPIVPVKYNLIAFFLSTELSMSSSFVSQNMYNSFTLLRQQIEPNQIHLIKQIPETRINTGFRHFNPLFKLAESGLIQVILMWLSILFCIDNLRLFHTLFFVLHIFSTNPVPLHFFIIVCSSGGLQVGLLFTE
jgi:hypothetical protein